MNVRNTTARWLVGTGCLVLLPGAGLHLAAAYPKVSASVLASNLDTGLQSALRCVFLIVGWHWIVLAAIAVFAVFSRAPVGKIVVLLCALALIFDAALMAAFLGRFLGTGMILASALLILCGGFALPPAKPVVEVGAK